MTVALRNPSTGRFAPRPPLVCCASCGRVLFENLAAELLCVWPRCGLARQVVGTSGADAGTLSAPSPFEEPSSGHGDPGAPSDALTGRTAAPMAAPVQADTDTSTEETH